MKSKKMIALLLCCALLMSIITTASAITLYPKAGGGSAQSGSVTKNSTGSPYMYVSSFPDATTGYFNCRIRRSSDSAAATPNYQFTSTGSKSMYYLDGMGTTNTAYFVRVQSGSAETNNLVISLNWNP